MQDADAVFNDY